MATGHANYSEVALEWFLTGFTARDLAEPLLSVDEGCSQAGANAPDSNGIAQAPAEPPP
jgi:hypothetical protein